MEKVKQHPLVIIFYLDAEMMKVRDVIIPFTESINQMLTDKDANALAFFIPTRGEERIECISSVTDKDIDMCKINKLMEDLKLNFINCKV